MNALITVAILLATAYDAAVTRVQSFLSPLPLGRAVHENPDELGYFDFVPAGGPGRGMSLSDLPDAIDWAIFTEEINGETA